jgi:type IV secretory pathway TraG/TraD family ATPase VirD4
MYVIVVAGLYAGLFSVRRQHGRVSWSLTTAIPTMIAVGIAVSFIPGLTALPDSLQLLLAVGLYFIPSAVVGRVFSSVRSNSVHQRGALLVSAEEGRRSRPRRPSGLTLGSHPVPPPDETKHFKIIGTTGTGKSTAIRELLAGALGRGDRAVIADPDGSYLRHFYQPQRGDLLLNPFDSRSARWDLYAEITQPHDADQLARSLVPDEEGAEGHWREYARTFLTALLRQLHRAQERDLARLYWLLLMAPAADLKQLLEATPAGPFLGHDNGKFFESVRSITGVHAAAIEHVARQTTGELLSVRKWIREGKGVLFLPYRANELASFRTLISSWMRLAIFESLSAPEGDQHLWFCVDELDALGPIDGLKDALARLRKYGGRCILGFQSIAQVRGTYGDAEAQTIVENCGNTLILRCSASERGGTAEFASRLIGKREIIRHETSRTYSSLLSTHFHSTRTHSNQHATEDAVLASEIEQFPDMTGLLKLASRPEWRRVSLSPIK